ncbi:MAG TPA: 50S ribosomal protein L23 [Candidatus Paceibacterota bacterium]
MALFNAFKRKKVPIPEKGVSKVAPAPAKASGKPAVLKEKKSDTVAQGTSLRVDAANEGGENVAHVILHPRITEKASFITVDGAYTFNISPRANKAAVKKAIQEIYGVTPVRINVMTIPAKKVFVRGRVGMKSSGKKAIVYLKKGDTIEFV